MIGMQPDFLSSLSLQENIKKKTNCNANLMSLRLDRDRKL